MNHYQQSLSVLSIPALDGSSAVVAAAEPILESMPEASAATATDSPVHESDPLVEPKPVVEAAALPDTAPAASDGAASPSWLIWLAGSGIALIFGLLMSGRRIRGHSGAALAAPLAERPQRRSGDGGTSDTENIEALGVDYDLSDDSPPQAIST